MEFKPITKGNTTPKGKHYLFVHACAADQALRKDVCRRLLSYEQGARCCLWYTDEPEIIFSAEGREKLSEMAVFIPLITEEYFRLFEEKYPGKKASDLFEDLQLRGVAVLPLLESAQLIPRFNRTFGEIHGIALSLPDADRMVEEQLKRLLSDNELEERITKEAFAGKLFLSYRKKDIKEAKEIMKAIHDTEAARAAAIWFDEFLIAGRDFNEDIMAQLDDCDAMALAVTPHLLEEGNYVRETEYQEAITRGRDVLPVEALRTDDDDLEKAFPGIKPRVSVHDKAALEKMLNDAGFSAVERLSPFGEYLLGMAFFIPINVEKDVERALRLFHSSADRDCIEACEQLGKLYLRGIGVKRDIDKAIRYKMKAYTLLMKEPVSKANIRHINRLFYEFDGLPLLLKENDRVSEANEIQQAFLSRIENSSFGSEDEFLLYRVNALTDLSNLFYEYDLGSGRQKSDSQPASMADVMASLYGGGSGPSDQRIRESWRLADRAMALLDAYRGDDRQMVTFLRVVTLDQYADLSKYKNDLRAAIRYKEQSKALIEPLAEETGDLEHMQRSFQISNNLGLFYREGMMAARMNSVEYQEYRRKAIENLDDGVRKARQLEKLSPNYRADLIQALSNRSLMASDPNERKTYLLECYEVYLKLLKDHDVSADVAWTFRGLGGAFSSVIYNIRQFTGSKDRRPIFEKVYGTAPGAGSGAGSGRSSGPSMGVGCLQWLILFAVLICVILQLTGAVDIMGFLNDKLGPYGTWIAVGAVVVLYLLTCIPRKKK